MNICKNLDCKKLSMLFISLFFIVSFFIKPYHASAATHTIPSAGGTINASNGDIIYGGNITSGNVTINVSDNVYLVGTINVSNGKTLTITGGGNLIHAETSGSFFKSLIYLNNGHLVANGCNLVGPIYANRSEAIRNGYWTDNDDAYSRYSQLIISNNLNDTISLTGVGLKGAISHAIYAYKGSSVSLSGCDVSNNNGSALVASKEFMGSVTIKNSTFSNNGKAFNSSFYDFQEIDGNLNASTSKWTVPKDKGWFATIDMYNGSLSMDRCTISDWACAGIQLQQSASSNTIKNVTINQPKDKYDISIYSDHAGRGVQWSAINVQNSSSLTLENSTISGTDSNVIYDGAVTALGNARITISDCNISEASQSGISAQGESNIFVNGSSNITSNKYNGAYVSGAGHLYLNDNTSFEGNGHDVYVDRSNTTYAAVDVNSNSVKMPVGIWIKDDYSYIYTNENVTNNSFGIGVDNPEHSRKVAQSANTSELGYIYTKDYDKYDFYSSGNDRLLCTGHNVNLSTGTGISNVAGGGKTYYGSTVKVVASTSGDYAFSEWKQGSSHLSSSADYDYTLSVHEDVTLTAYAVYTPIDYTITYNLNGGSLPSGKTNPSSYRVTTDTFTLNNPEKPGYTFTGWTGSNGVAPQTSVSIPKGSTGNRTYSANWKAIDYTIDYDLDGGSLSGGKTNPTSYNITTATFTLNNPEKPGHTFTGWTGSNGTTPQTSVSIPKGSTGNKSYKANWQVNNYTLTLNKGTGIKSVSGGGSKPYNSSVTIDAVLETGYHWVNWTGTLGTKTDKSYTFYMPAYNVTMTANGAPNTYTIKFDGNGHTGGSMSDMSCTYDQSYNLNEKGFVKRGYTFKNWNTKKDGTGTSYADKASVKNLTSTHNGTVTLYAQWTPNEYTLTLDHNGGTYNSATKSTYKVIYDSSQNSDVSGKLPYKRGYTFTGYWTAKTGGTQVYTNEGKAINDNVHWKKGLWYKEGNATLYAQWTPNNYNLTLDHTQSITSVLGKWNNENKSKIVVTYDSSEMKYNNNVVTSVVPSLRGYTFKGYWTAKNMQGTQVFSSAGKPINDGTYWKNGLWYGITDVTLYAGWQQNNYTLTLDHNGGTYSGASKNSYTVTYDSSQNSDISGKLPYKKGYTFTGYWTAKTGGTQVYTNEGKAINDNVHWKNGLWYKDSDATLYAQWTPNTYTLKFHPNEGGVVTPVSDMTITYDTSVTLPNGGLYYAKYTINGENVTSDVLAGNIMPAGYEAEIESISEDEISALAEEIQIAENELGMLREQEDASEEDIQRLEEELNRLSMEYEQYAVEATLINEEPKAYPSMFMGWVLENERNSLVPKWKAEQISVNTIVETAGVTDINNASITLYAIWDDCPWIVAEDLYYTLHEAQSGFITHDELMSHASAYDREDGSNIPVGEKFKIIDYKDTDFTMFENNGSVTETYWVKDSSGNVYKKTITVHIVDSEPKVVMPIGTTRFINEKYYYETYENGGLEENSIWKTDAEYVETIKKSFENSSNDTPLWTFEFSYEVIRQMKEFVQNNGIGNSKYEDALKRFYEEFMVPNMVN